MKKYNLLKVLAITFLITIVLTLFVPGSTADYSGGITQNGINGVGVWSMLSNLNIALSYFSTVAILIIAIAIFYAVIGKTKSYNAFVGSCSKKFEGHESLLVIISTILFALVAMFVNDIMVLLVFVPFVYTIMRSLNIRKEAILSSTIIASLIGGMCGIYNSTLFSVFSLSINTLLLVKIVLFVITIFILIMFTAPRAKEQNVVVKEEIKEESKKEANVSENKAPAKKTVAKKAETKKAPAKKTTSKGSKTTKTTSKGRKKVAK